MAVATIDVAQGASRSAGLPCKKTPQVKITSKHSNCTSRQIVHIIGNNVRTKVPSDVDTIHATTSSNHNTDVMRKTTHTEVEQKLAQRVLQERFTSQSELSLFATMHLALASHRPTLSMRLHEYGISKTWSHSTTSSRLSAYSTELANHF